METTYKKKKTTDFTIWLEIFVFQISGTMYWRDCSPPFHDALENQYNRQARVETFTQHKANGTQNSWTHDLHQMRQTNQKTGLIKPLRRICESPSVP